MPTASYDTAETAQGPRRAPPSASYFSKEKCSCCYGNCGILGRCSPTKITVMTIYTLSFIGLCISSVWLRLTVFSSQLHDVAWFVATVFVMFTIPLSAYEIAGHLSNYRSPELQKYIVRILWMVPIYSVESLCALVWRESKVVLETLRESYEAYVIFCLLQLMITSIAPTEEELERLVATKTRSDLHHMRPFCFLKDWEGSRFVSIVRKSTLQYVVVKLMGTAIELCTIGISDPSRHVPTHHENGTLIELAAYGADSTTPSSSASCANEEIPNFYCDGCFTRFDRPYIYVTLATNFSQIWAMYALVLFYHSFMIELAPIKPLGKLITVKAVVFFSFWQEVAIAGAVQLGWIGATTNPSPTDGCFTEDDVAKGFQDFLICIEMFLAAVAHHYVFSFEPHRKSSGESTGLLTAFLESSLPTDVIHTAAEEFRPSLPQLPKITSIRRTFGSKHSSASPAPSSPMSADETSIF